MSLPIIYRRCAASFLALAETVSDQDQRRVLIEAAEKWRDLALAIEGYMKENDGKAPNLRLSTEPAQPLGSSAPRTRERRRRLH